MQQALLADGKASGATASQQVRTLLWRKELPLKCRRPITSLCEVALPVLLCGLVLLSRLAKDTQVSVGNITYVQDSYERAAFTLSPIAFGEAQALSHARADDIQEVLQGLNHSNLTGVPNAIWPLALYLEYAAGTGLAPFDGNFLAVAPDVPQVRQLLNDSLQAHWPHVEVGDFDRPLVAPSNATKVRSRAARAIDTPPRHHATTPPRTRHHAATRRHAPPGRRRPHRPG